MSIDKQTEGMKYYILMVALLAFSLSAEGQRRRARKPQPTEEELRLQERMETMAEATQKIIFIDSLVVDKGDILQAIGISAEGGTLTTTDIFTQTSLGDSTYAHVNQMGDRCYFARPDGEGGTRLYRSDNYGGKWSIGTRLEGLDDISGGAAPNYPFMMADGMTMYFAAKGEESIGGYDIFVTRYNLGSDKFYHAENIGMPFNSTANDYMYAIDEYYNIGWFVSDRFQPAGKACVYIFIPEDSHATYNTDDYTEEQIKNFAALTSIKDTWGNGERKDAALRRLEEMAGRSDDNDEEGGNKMAFVVNDNTVYTSYADFRGEGNAEKYRQLEELEAEKAELDASLERSRDYYYNAGEKIKADIGEDILEKEKRSEELEAEIGGLTKEIRNSENRLLER